MERVPEIRIRGVNDRPIMADRGFVAYWMIACRRTRANFALQRAVEHATALRKPLVVYEPLRLDYPHASERLHRFIAEGMLDNLRAFQGTPVAYLPFIERAPHQIDGLLTRLASDACVIVTDDYPAFFLPKAIAAAAATLDVRMEAVDGNGLIPMRAATQTFVTAHSFRAFIQRTFREHITERPADLDFKPLPKAPALAEIRAAWPMATKQELEAIDRLLPALPIDHGIGPVDTRGGSAAARARLRGFIDDGLVRYHDDSRHPDLDGSSRLSPYLHFGHISSHEIFDAVMTAERWTTRQLGSVRGGAREGWWGVSAGAESFLDQFITWRELGFNMCVTRPDDHTHFESLPAWALATLKRHAKDKREWVYSRAAFESASTHDPVWNAAQRQLTEDGWMHNYLRMLWGKKILEWSPSPEDALETMSSIMNAHALDGRDPNSWSGYFWTLGRYDRPWAPERPVYGTIRYMSSDNTVKKLKMKKFMDRYGERGLF